MEDFSMREGKLDAWPVGWNKGGEQVVLARPVNEIGVGPARREGVSYGKKPIKDD